jgi:hypothetical protein
MAEHLPGKHKALSSNPSTTEKGREGQREVGLQFEAFLIFVLHIQDAQPVKSTQIPNSPKPGTALVPSI